tara:strand:- start:2577 stop:2768 length:192 start_codon:yes stop_codon:yes gene_type:complete
MGLIIFIIGFFVVMALISANKKAEKEARKRSEILWAEIDRLEAQGSYREAGEIREMMYPNIYK